MEATPKTRTVVVRPILRGVSRYALAAVWPSVRPERMASFTTRLKDPPVFEHSPPKTCFYLGIQGQRRPRRGIISISTFCQS